MSENRTCEICGNKLWTLNPETAVCEDCRERQASDSHPEVTTTSELPKDFSSFVKQTDEIPGAFSDAVLERVRSEATVPVSVHEPETIWSWQAGVLVWLFSVAALYFVGFIFLVIGFFYLKSHGQPLTPATVESSVPFAIIQIMAALPAHILSLVVAWSVVTKVGKRPFLATMGWKWHSRFGPVHAFGFIILTFAVGLLIARFIPDHPTSFEHLMELVGLTKFGRVAIFLVAVVSAPFEEEVVYRGVLFPSLQNKFGITWAIVIVSLLFGGVHVPQYLPSYQAITLIMTLSVGLTLVRAYSKSILPTVVIHVLFNGIQLLLSFLSTR